VIAADVYRTSPSDLLKAINGIIPTDADWLQWEPEVLLGYFSKVKGTGSQAALDKIMAVQAAAAHMQFACSYSYPFSAIISCFCNFNVPRSIKPSHVEEIFYTVGQLQKIADLIHDDDLEFVGEVPGYIAACAHYASWRVLPKSLDFAQGLLSHLCSYVPTKEELLLVGSMDLVKDMTHNEVVDVVDSMTKDTPGNSRLITDLLGCYVYDPTLVPPVIS
jgi:hypothetical protein